MLSAARLVFVEIGYDAATVRDIVGRTDLSPGTFYNYFPDKRAVLAAIAHEISAECRRRTREARSRAKNLQEIMYGGFRAYYDFIATDRDLFALLRRNVAALRTLGLDETGFRAGLKDLRADLLAASAASTIPDNLPLDYLVPAIGAIAFEIGAEMISKDPPDVEGATRFSAELFLSGLHGLLLAPPSSDTT